MQWCQTECGVRRSGGGPQYGRRGRRPAFTSTSAVTKNAGGYAIVMSHLVEAGPVLLQALSERWGTCEVPG